MIVLPRRKCGIRLATVYFLDAPINSLPADLARLRQAISPVSGSTEFPTLHIDLTRTESDLLADCSKSNRYKISRASSRDELTFEPGLRPSEQELADFITFYDHFAASKDLPYSEKQLLESLHAADALRLSRVTTPEGQVLCQHLHVADAHRARLLYSASHFRDVKESSVRSLIGRANRALHWVEFKKFKEDGLAIYDFGGFVPNSTDPAIRQISEFKASFGGTSVVEYHAMVGLTLVGKVALWARRVLGKDKPPPAM